MGCEVGARRGRASEFYELAPPRDSVRSGRLRGPRAADPGRRYGRKRPALCPGVTGAKHDINSIVGSKDVLSSGSRP
jgi:hypothetical protein